MSTVTRLEWEACDVHNCHCDIVESKDGDMVNYDDYVALEKKLTDMAVQLANAESKCRELSSKAMELVCEASLVYSKYNDTQMPDRDLVDMQTLQEMHDLCKGVAQ
ncbi:hypothetical protein [Citrobacter braakii]|uniref:hypothetical protein n=1 Tax=Citrobacter braakii TaxID=57706 RepID=UPI001C7D10EC|nr:hypothetical protein [Citrobacter braakii]